MSYETNIVKIFLKRVKECFHKIMDIAFDLTDATDHEIYYWGYIAFYDGFHGIGEITDKHVTILCQMDDEWEIQKFELPIITLEMNEEQLTEYIKSQPKEKY